MTLPDQKMLNNLILFLDRVDLKGAEVPAYIEVRQFINALQETLAPPPVVAPATDVVKS